MQSAAAIGLVRPCAARPLARPHRGAGAGLPPRGLGLSVAAALPRAGLTASGRGFGLVPASLFGLWYLFNIYFNIYKKQVLEALPYPINITTVQFAVGTVIALFMWITGILKRPKISGAQLLAILPLAIVHTMGNLFTNMSFGKVAVSFTHTIKAMEFTNMSLGKVAVSFTHTIKAMEPFFSVLLSAIFLGELPTPWVVMSLVPIVGGVALASLTEASFNWAGFWSAMASNVTFQSRNVLSKKLMVKKEESLDNINLFSIITVMSFFLLAPVTLLTEGVKVSPAFLQSAGLNLKQIYTRSLISAFCFHAYQQVSYMILARCGAGEAYMKIHADHGYDNSALPSEDEYTDDDYYEERNLEDDPVGATLSEVDGSPEYEAADEADVEAYMKLLADDGYDDSASSKKVRLLTSPDGNTHQVVRQSIDSRAPAPGVGPLRHYEAAPVLGETAEGERTCMQKLPPSRDHNAINGPNDGTGHADKHGLMMDLDC